ncbi:MAG: TetR/AcrR family transcriptional regulator [Burkholderiales bacterium]
MTASRRSAPASERILDVAERLAQTLGFNGFSYADIAAELAVTKASLHYHFPSKADLGRALIVRYQLVFRHALESIDGQSGTAADRLRKYIDLYDGVMREDRLCLCGMLAAEYATLPPPMQEELRRFFDTNEQWLIGVLERGQQSGELDFTDRPQERARVLLGGLEGAMLIARSYKDDRRFRAAAEHLLADLKPKVQAPQRRLRTPKRAPRVRRRAAKPTG